MIHDHPPMVITPGTCPLAGWSRRVPGIALYTRGKISQMDSSDRLARLIATRDQLSRALDNCDSPRDLPGLSREYRLVLAEIDSLHTEADADVVDQLAARRTAKGSAGAARSS